MSLQPINAQGYHDLYERLPHEVALHIDDAYRAAVGNLKANGEKVLGDDEAERLVAAITCYVTSANPDLYNRLLVSPEDEAYTPMSAAPRHNSIDAGDVYP